MEHSSSSSSPLPPPPPSSMRPLIFVQPTPKKPCRCGSSNHQKTNHKDCPLNKNKTDSSTPTTNSSSTTTAEKQRQAFKVNFDTPLPEQPRETEFHETPGPRNLPPNFAKSKRHVLKLFIPESLAAKFADFASKKLREKPEFTLSKNGKKFGRKSHGPVPKRQRVESKDFNADEIYAYFAILFLIGLNHQPSLKDYWRKSPKDGKSETDPNQEEETELCEDKLKKKYRRATKNFECEVFGSDFIPTVMPFKRFREIKSCS